MSTKKGSRIVNVTSQAKGKAFIFQLPGKPKEENVEPEEGSQLRNLRESESENTRMRSRTEIEQRAELARESLQFLLKNDERCQGKPFDELPPQSCVLMGVSGALNWVLDMKSHSLNLDEMFVELEKALNEYDMEVEAGVETED